MNRPFTLFALSAAALWAQAPSERVLTLQIVSTDKQGVVGAKVKVIDTGQEEVSQSGGSVKLKLPAVKYGPGSDLKLAVTYQNLVIHEPPDGNITLSNNLNRVIVIELGPKGDPTILAGAGRRIVAGAIRQRDEPSTGRQERSQPPLTRYIQQWATEYGFSVEQVQGEVRRWAEDVERKRSSSSLEDRALAAYAAHDFDKAADLYKDALAAALPRVEEARKTERKELRIYLDDAIGRANALRDSFHYAAARVTLEEALPHVDKPRFRAWWIEMTLRTANAAMDEGQFGPASTSGPALASAVRLMRDLLRDLSAPSDRFDWAGTQTNLGMALELQAARSSGAEANSLLVQAIDAYRAALQIQTKTDSPQDWAVTQNNLGNALTRQAAISSSAEAKSLLSQAVDTYRAALQVRTITDLPQDWAMTQNNLGVALRDQAARSSGVEAETLLSQSVDAIRAALQFYKKTGSPQDWAGTEDNLGVTLRHQADRSSGAEAKLLLSQAMEAHRAALQVLTKTDLPQAWADAQVNLGLALRDQAAGSSGVEAESLLREAVAAYRAALQVQTKADLPEAWGRTLRNLADAQAALNDWNGAAQSLEQALEVGPQNTEVLGRLEFLYQEDLFLFAKAFELGRRRLQLDNSVPTRLAFAENNLTTGRFRECMEGLNSLSATDLDANSGVVRASFLFACQYAAGDQNARGSAEALIKLSDSLQKPGWTFAGTRHFLSTDPAFAKTRESWVKLFDRLEAGDGPGMADAFREIQKTLVR